MMSIVNTPAPPYYAVIFTSLLSRDTAGYAEMNAHLEALVQEQPGFLGMESASEGIGITVSYWESLEAIRAWHLNWEHRSAQKQGYQRWYQAFKTRVCLVERDYGFTSPLFQEAKEG